MKRLYTIFCIMILFTLTISCTSANNHVIINATEEVITNNVKSAVLIEPESGEILFEKNQNARLPVASMVKLMTILITCEEISSGNLTLETKIKTNFI